MVYKIKNKIKQIKTNIKIFLCWFFLFLILFSCRSNVSIYDKQLIKHIYNNFKILEPTPFLDFLSKIDYANIDEEYYKIICFMRDYSIAIDPLFRRSPLHAIKNLNELNDNYDLEIVKKYINFDLNNKIKNLELNLLQGKNYKIRNNLFFGRVNNKTPIGFELLDKIGDDYLILQNSVIDLGLESDEIYQEGVCILKDNILIKKYFELEQDMIKDIFIFSEEDYDNYNVATRKIKKYLDISLDVVKNDNSESQKENLEFEIKQGFLSYLVKDNYKNVINKYYDGKNFIEISDDTVKGIRLAILVKGDRHEK